MGRIGRTIRWASVVGAVTGSLLLLSMYRSARSEPIVRRASVSLPGWPDGAGPVRVALWSDLHLGNAATDERRLARIADAITAQRPDLVVIAGDLVAGHEAGFAATVAPGLAAAMRRLRAPLGTLVVLGNHDHWTGPRVVAAAVRRGGGTLLSNEAVARGPLVVGGVDDDYTGHARIGATLAAMRRLNGARLLVSHSPDIVPRLPAGATLLAGHSHCGQIVLPLYGPITVPLGTGRRYLCGVVREGRRTTIVAAGTGTSLLPLRLNAPPDVWLVTLGPGR